MRIRDIITSRKKEGGGEVYDKTQLGRYEYDLQRVDNIGEEYVEVLWKSKGGKSPKKVKILGEITKRNIDSLHEKGEGKGGGLAHS